MSIHSINERIIGIRTFFGWIGYLSPPLAPMTATAFMFTAEVESWRPALTRGFWKRENMMSVVVSGGDGAAESGGVACQVTTEAIECGLSATIWLPVSHWEQLMSCGYERLSCTSVSSEN